MSDSSRDPIAPVDDAFLPDEVLNEYREMAGLPPINRAKPRATPHRPSKRTSAGKRLNSRRAS
jgi:hypothetical protein